MSTVSEPRSWIVEVWARIFAILGVLSLFTAIRKIIPRLQASYRFVEYYVAGNTALSLVALAVATWRRDVGETLLLAAVTGYGCGFN